MLTDAGLDFTFEDGEVLCRLRWPAALHSDAMIFVRDNLLTERLGSEKLAGRVLDDLTLPAALLPKFLADRPFFPPEPPEALAIGVDLDDLVAEFGVMVNRLRTLPAARAVLLRIHA